jgi:putative hydrolase of the HAD superfamily
MYRSALRASRSRFPCRASAEAVQTLRPILRTNTCRREAGRLRTQILEAAAGIEPASRVLQTLACATRLRRQRRAEQADGLARLLPASLSSVIRRIAGMAVQAVVFDFYGTLARATAWLSVDMVLAEHGYELPEEIRDRFWNEGLDGMEHLEHSTSRERYQAWQHKRLMAMLAETDVHPGEYESILEKLRQGNEARVLEAYDETAAVLTELRARGLPLAICSNWDWDLDEAVDEVGLSEAVDVVVSSAWAGARKPHPRIFEHTLSKVGTDAGNVVFVGDTWGPDVVGPRAMGMTPLYLRRDGHWPDTTAPRDPDAEGISIGADLRAVLDVV